MDAKISRPQGRRRCKTAEKGELARGAIIDGRVGEGKGKGESPVDKVWGAAYYQSHPAPEQLHEGEAPVRQDELRDLVWQFTSLVDSATRDDQLDDSTLRRLLEFIAQVILVLEQAYQDAYGLLVQIKLLPDNVDEATVRDLRERIEVLTARSHYRDAMEICSRLGYLRHQFESRIEPLLGTRVRSQDWRQLLYLIDDREGRVIMLIERLARELSDMLSEVPGPGLAGARQAAAARAEELRELLSELYHLNASILGLSGTEGLLELTADRGRLRQQGSVIIDNRDQSVTHGPRVTVSGGGSVSGSMVAGGDISGTLSTGGDPAEQKALSEAIAELAALLGELKKSLTPDAAKQLDDDFATLTNEAGKEKPRREWYELSASGLLDAANACKDLVAPIGVAVKAILAILGSLSA